MGTSHRCARRPWHRQDGEWRVRPHRVNRIAAATRQRTLSARCQRGAHHRVRHRLRDPQSHLDFALHRLTRQAAAYRDRRVLLAGDAAHVHPPMGGQGLNIGVQDAVNLGWKLAQVVKRTSPESLLDTYHAERHPVAARVLRNTMAQVALRRTDDRSKALSDTVCRTARDGRAAPAIGWRDVRSGRSLRSRRGASAARTPHAGSRPRHHRRRATRLHAAAPCAAACSSIWASHGGFDIAPWSDRIQSVDANYEGAWELPVLGAVTAPTAVLIRPDGYVAWVGEKSQSGLTAALTEWFGPPAP